MPLFHRLDENGWLVPLLRDKPRLKFYYEDLKTRVGYKEGILRH
jgi:hypothetical protein